MGTCWLGHPQACPAPPGHVLLVQLCYGDSAWSPHPQSTALAASPTDQGLLLPPPMLSGSPIAGEVCRDVSWPFLHRVTRQIPSFLVCSSSTPLFFLVLLSKVRSQVRCIYAIHCHRFLAQPSNFSIPSSSSFKVHI